MSFSDYVSILALLIALISLYFSAKNSLFTRKVKSAELRSELLVKLSKASAAYISLVELTTEALVESEKLNDVEMFKAFDISSEHKIVQERINSIQKRTQDAPSSNVVSIYEVLNHEIESLLADIERARQKGVKEYQSHKTRIEESGSDV